MWRRFVAALHFVPVWVFFKNMAYHCWTPSLGSPLVLYDLYVAVASCIAFVWRARLFIYFGLIQCHTGSPELSPDSSDESTPFDRFDRLRLRGEEECHTVPEIRRSIGTNGPSSVDRERGAKPQQLLSFGWVAYDLRFPESPYIPLHTFYAYDHTVEITDSQQLGLCPWVLHYIALMPLDRSNV